MQIGVAGRLVVLAWTGLCVMGQQAPVQPAEVAPDRPLLRMEVNLVQLDVTVTDSKDRHVSDLKASDFTVLQDGKPQKITHFSYIPTPSRPQDLPPLPLGNYSRSRVLAQPPGARPKPSEVRRTIAVVIDDLALSFANSQRVRDEVQAFIANDILPGDLVAIFRTSSGVSALQQFTTDRRILMASARQMRFQMLNRVGVDPLGVFQGDASARDREPRASYARQDQIAVASIEALQHILGGIRALPGRKSLVVISEQLASRQLGAEGFVLSRRLGSLIDQANRSGVVVYTVDPQGGPPLVRGAEEMFPPLGGRLPSSTGILRRDPRYIDYGTAHDGLGLLAVQTGGRFLRGGNTRERLRFAADDQLGYYLLGYAPEAGTFPADLAVQKFHRVKVRTKRSGLEVRSREGFFGLTDRVLVQEPETRAERLLAALYSPLRNNDIRLSLTSLFDVNGQTGPAVLSMLHVDARDLKFEEQADGSKQAQLDLVTAAYD